MSMPSWYAVAKFWSTQRPLWVVDLGEPSCFACGFFSESSRSSQNAKRLETRWEKAGLERAHVIAKSAGGSDEAENIVLLCSKCHPAAPMTRVPEIMYSWIDLRPKDGEFDRKFALVAEVMVEIERRGGNLADMRDLDSATISRVAKSLGVGYHGGRVSASSMAAVVLAAAAVKSGK